MPGTRGRSTPLSAVRPGRTAGGIAADDDSTCRGGERRKLAVFGVFDASEKSGGGSAREFFLGANRMLNSSQSRGGMRRIPLRFPAAPPRSTPCGSRPGESHQRSRAAPLPRLNPAATRTFVSSITFRGTRGSLPLTGCRVPSPACSWCDRLLMADAFRLRGERSVHGYGHGHAMTMRLRHAFGMDLSFRSAASLKACLTHSGRLTHATPVRSLSS